MIEVFKMLSQHGHALTVLQGQVWVSPFGLMDLLQGKGTNVDLGPVVAEGTWIRLCCLPANITRSGKKRKRRQQPVLGSVTFHIEHSPKMWHSKNKSKGKAFSMHHEGPLCQKATDQWSDSIIPTMHITARKNWKEKTESYCIFQTTWSSCRLRVHSPGSASWLQIA